MANNAMAVRGLLLFALISTACARILEESKSADENYYDAEDGDDNTNVIAQWYADTSYRVEQDVLDMWDSSPSSWGEEYWEVFGSMMLLVFLLVGSCLFLCCAPICCFSDDGHRPLQVKTIDELNQEQKQRLDKPILDKTDQQESQLAQEEPVYSPSLDAEGATTTAQETDRDSSMDKPRRFRRQRRSLWSEVVLVWSDFLKHGFNHPVEEEEYQRYEEEAATTSTRKSKSRRRRKSAEATTSEQRESA